MRIKALKALNGEPYNPSILTYKNPTIVTVEKGGEGSTISLSGGIDCHMNLYDTLEINMHLDLDGVPMHLMVKLVHRLPMPEVEVYLEGKELPYNQRYEEQFNEIKQRIITEGRVF